MEVWYKFRDLKLPDHLYPRHAELKEYVAKAIINGTIQASFKKLSEAVEWYNEIEPQS